MRKPRAGALEEDATNGTAGLLLDLDLLARQQLLILLLPIIMPAEVKKRKRTGTPGR